MDHGVNLDTTHSVARFAPDAAALRHAADLGFRSVVNVRTSDEQHTITPDTERRIAGDAGLAYLHHPVAPDALDDALVDDFRRKLSDLPQPVLHHCASGKRAGAMTLMALAAAQGLEGEAAIARGRERGLDLSQDKIGQFVKDYADRKSRG
ncbi:MAG: hypothetical protein HUJ24_04200 [Rhodobacteraceae bacterium]|nr:hypothetical protein [Paracoccaceae bacterium]